MGAPNISDSWNSYLQVSTSKTRQRNVYVMTMQSYPWQIWPTTRKFKSR